MLCHNVEDHVGEYHVVFFLPGQLFGDGLKFKDLIGYGQVFKNHLLELFLDESVLLLVLFGFVFLQHEIQGVGLIKDYAEVDEVFE